MSPQSVSLFVAVGRKMCYANFSSHQMKVGVNCGKIVKLINYVPTTKHPDYVWKHFIKHSRIYTRYWPCSHWAVGTLYVIYGAKAGLSLWLSSVCDAGAALQLLSQVAGLLSVLHANEHASEQTETEAAGPFSSLCHLNGPSLTEIILFSHHLQLVVNKGRTELRELWQINSLCSHRS